MIGGAQGDLARAVAGGQGTVVPVEDNHDLSLHWTTHHHHHHRELPAAPYQAPTGHHWAPQAPAQQAAGWNLNPNAPPFAPKLTEEDDTLEDAELEDFPLLINDDGSQCLIEDFRLPRKMASSPSDDGTVTQPCAFCGKEATLECSNCVNLQRRGINIPPTFFCSVEHQQKVWKQHHEQVHLKYAAKKLQNGQNGGALNPTLDPRDLSSS